MDASESANSAQCALTEQNVRSQLRSMIKDASDNAQSNESDVPKKSEHTLIGGRDDESATTETVDSAGVKRKRVRHRKKKNANDENQMNLPNVGQPAEAAAAAAAAAYGGSAKRHTAPAKNPFEKPQSKGNSHVR